MRIYFTSFFPFLQEKKRFTGKNAGGTGKNRPAGPLTAGKNSVDLAAAGEVDGALLHVADHI